MTILLNKMIPFEVIEGERVFVLLDLIPVYEYDSSNNRTANIIGWRYFVVNTESYEKYRIKVAESKPLISRKDLQAKREAGVKFFVEFTNAFLKMYRSSTGTFEDSITAESISFAEAY